MRTGILAQQNDPQARPYWVWVFQGDLGPNGGWVRYNAGFPGSIINLDRNRSYIRCNNCSPGGINSSYSRYNNSFQIENHNSGKPPITEIFVPAGLPGETGAIVSFYPPITYTIDCEQSDLRIYGGQTTDDYELTITASGFILDFNTDEIIIPFKATTKIQGPGPIVGYTVSQYTFGPGQRDLRANVYYTDENNNLGDFRKEFKLSLSDLETEDTNMTLSGFNYYFDVDKVTLDNITRVDGANDQCGNSKCILTFDVNYTDQTDLNTIQTERKILNMNFTVDRIVIEPEVNYPGNRVVAYNKEGDYSEVVYQAFGGTASISEYIQSAPLINIECEYTVDINNPSCFIETPEVCNLTIKDQSGILLDQTYFGRPIVSVTNQPPGT